MALMALVLGAVAGLLAGRLRPTPSRTPGVALARGVVAEGMARAASVGRFRGHVHALVLGRRGVRGTQAARYLISDPEKALPFWVDQEEIDRIGLEEAETEVKDQTQDRKATPDEPRPEAAQLPANEVRLAPAPDQTIPHRTQVLGYVSVEQNGDHDDRRDA